MMGKGGGGGGGDIAQQLNAITKHVQKIKRQKGYLLQGQTL